MTLNNNCHSNASLRCMLLMTFNNECHSNASLRCMVIQKKTVVHEHRQFFKCYSVLNFFGKENSRRRSQRCGGAFCMCLPQISAPKWNRQKANTFHSNMSHNKHSMFCEEKKHRHQVHTYSKKLSRERKIKRQNIMSVCPISTTFATKIWDLNDDHR
ncbi:hypothetical protein EGR_10327 [Echinococcus granulosus]|uniref:Uncharacterized protein n=1 Tax=Echinococcus granulosus TaxID=6210 RepID=W6U133_ECHGR|nr:hypothetical protein EGR_10327 [Echinococcus granulosus]EUB54820.1 hypothetical protein EGR_10327 [Echinococcus granulosus]